MELQPRLWMVLACLSGLTAVAAGAFGAHGASDPQAKAWLQTDYEAQVDLGTGAIMHVAYRRSDLIESIHDGSWFHDSAKLWLFFPSGILLRVASVS